MVFQSLVNNAAILLALSYLYTLASRYWQKNDLRTQGVRGLLFGMVVVGVMLSPLQLAPGLVFDTRSVVIGISGLFGGPLTAAVTAIFSIGYRIWLGGVGVAAGVATAFSSATIGVLFFYWRRKWKQPSSTLNFYLFGLLVHVAMILCMFALPRDLAWQTIVKITVPVMLIYPLATLLLCLLLADQEARVVTERQLLESEERFRTLFEQAGDAIFLSDFNSNLVDVNRAAEKSLGYTRKELLGLRVQDVDPKALDWEAQQEFWQEQFKAGAPVTFESVHRRKDGTVLPVEIRAGFVEQGPQPLVLGLVRDISERVQAEKERKSLEDQLLHAQKMEAVGTLAGGIAHEFNNILTAIVGYAELSLISHERKGCSDPQYLQEILNSGKRATELVKRILAFSRKAEVTEFKVFDVNKELEHVVTILEKTIPREIRIKKELAPDVGTMRGDAGQFEQVLLNLGTNAKHAMPDGGLMTFRTERVQVGMDQASFLPDMKPGSYVRLRVSDTGHGMDTETIKHIFDPFFTTKEVGEGTGLGLSMVYGIVKGHQGYIDCTSELGKGTTFEIFLPTAKEPLAPIGAAAALKEPAAGHNETILVVDDEPTLLDLAKSFLEGNGYKVLTANRGEEALRIFAQQGKDIAAVLLDVSMPGMGGRRCLQGILEIKSQAKVIVTSGYALDDSLQEILADGATAFVAKPYGQKDLVDAVHVALVD